MDISYFWEREADYKCYEASGSHHQIGNITASHAGSLIVDSGLLPEHVQFVKECRDIVTEHFPELREEFIGYAQTLNVTLDDLLWNYSPGINGGCSAVAIRTEDRLVVGRNYDYFFWEDRRHLILTRPDLGFAHVGMHEGLVGGRFDGLNEKGLFVCFNGAGEPDFTTPGITFHLVVRFLLEKCSSAEEALHFLMILPLMEPKSYLVADLSDAYVVENHPQKRRVRSFENNHLVMTNHFIHQDMRDLQPGFQNSVRRYNQLEAASNSITYSNDPIKHLVHSLSEHQAPVCGHVDGIATLWSCITELDLRKISYCLGAPCRNEYQHVYSF